MVTDRAFAIRRVLRSISEYPPDLGAEPPSVITLGSTTAPVSLADQHSPKTYWQLEAPANALGAAPAHRDGSATRSEATIPSLE
jgi:hypothetical protein